MTSNAARCQVSLTFRPWNIENTGANNSVVAHTCLMKQTYRIIALRVNYTSNHVGCAIALLNHWCSLATICCVSEAKSSWSIWSLYRLRFEIQCNELLKLYIGYGRVSFELGPAEHNRNMLVASGFWNVCLLPRRFDYGCETWKRRGMQIQPPHAWSISKRVIFITNSKIKLTIRL